MDSKLNINIKIDHKHYQVHARQMTGIELKRLAEVPDTNLLFREVRGPGDDEQVQDETVVHLHDGDEFYDMPPGNFGWQTRGA
jgi:hypothetical protein